MTPDPNFPVPAVYPWPTNGALIADVARLGYIKGRVVDLTYGRGLFWTAFKPDDLTAHDLFKGDGVDFTDLPEQHCTYDTTVFDPPYKLTGTPAEPEFADRYGLTAGVPWQMIMGLQWDGAREAARVCKVGGHILVKCQDQVASGAVRWQTLQAVEAVKLRARLVDRFDMIGTARPQPKTTGRGAKKKPRRQVHAHGRPSTLLVFRKDTCLHPDHRT